MNIESIREYSLAKPGTSEKMPFDDDVLVFRVMGKIFLLMSISEGIRMNLKCDPEYAIELRERYEGEIIPGYHMNKQHWNTVYFNGNLSDKLLKELIDHSYDLIAKSLKKAQREELALLAKED